MLIGFFLKQDETSIIVSVLPIWLGLLSQQQHADFVINCAGYTGKPNVDACETNKGECRKGNIELPKVISNACALVGIPWGHVSSGCIYTGNRLDGSGFTEEDPPNFHHFLYVMPESRRQSKYATFHAVCLDSHLRQYVALPGCPKWQMWPGAIYSDT